MTLKSKLSMKTSTALLIVILVSAFFLFFKLGLRSFWDPDEGRYAEMILEMKTLSGWVTPHFYLQPHLDKPPMFLWLGALSATLFGISEFSLRLVSASAGLGVVLVCFLFGKRMFNVNTGFYSSLVLTTAFGFIGVSRLLSTDMSLCFFMSLAMYLLYAALDETEARKKRLFWFSAYLVMGLGFLTKGVIAFLFPLAIFMVYFIVTKQWRRIFELKIFRGIFIAGLVALPWIILVSIQNENFLYYFIVDQHILRFFTAKHERTESFFFPFCMTVGGFAPWALIIPLAFLTMFRSQDKESSEVKRKLVFFMVWALFVLTFFSFSKSKLPTYITPLFLPLAVFVGKFWESICDTPKSESTLKSIKRHFTVLVVLLFLISFGVAIYLNIEQPGSFSQAIIPVLLITVLFIPMLLLTKKNKFKQAFFSVIICECFLFIYGLNITVPNMDTIRGTKTTATKVEALRKPADKVLLYDLEKKPSIYFYVKGKKAAIHDLNQLKQYLSKIDSERYFVIMRSRDHEKISTGLRGEEYSKLISGLKPVYQTKKLIALSNKSD